MKRTGSVPARRVDPILQELYAVKSSLNRKAKFDLKVLCVQVRKEAARHQRETRRAA